MAEDEIIQQLHQYGVKQLTTETREGTYFTTNRSSFRTQQIYNRSSADWKKAQYVIIRSSNNNTPDLNTCIAQWKNFAEKKQVLIIYEDNQWKLYNSEGEEVTLEMLFSNNRINESHQQIFYGAPGTGKSHSIKRETKAWEAKGRVVRTTFHPDSDYSTFVGAYKPTTESVQRYDIYNKPITKDGVPVMEQIITYEFVPQAFLQAYVEAWKNSEEPEFLIIEEINRGNCAQIFGDLFQLLDRGNDGYSDYAIRADKDLQKFLAKAFADVALEEYPKVKTGEVMILPKNLYIRATMNTSDQSLFPIDSAFKRRWDWKYIPISKGADNGIELNWQIDVDGERYDWWRFIQTINKEIAGKTLSEDKQLGFFFCKAKECIINAETFVGKVVFYLWNDVFKDFGFDSDIFQDQEDNENPKLSFNKFYTPNGEIRTETVKKFLRNLGLSPAVCSSDDDLKETTAHTQEYDEENNTEERGAFANHDHSLI